MPLGTLHVTVTKFFHEEQSVECPRCGERLSSPERIEPPWRKKTFTVKETAQILSVSQSWLYERASREEIPHHKLGGTALRFTEEDIEEILEDKRAKKEQSQPHRHSRAAYPPQTSSTISGLVLSNAPQHLIIGIAELQVMIYADLNRVSHQPGEGLNAGRLS